MADVFLSYKRTDRAAVVEIARQIRGLGLSVWFDASLTAGETFNAEIDREARGSKAVLVCWSPAARQSRWVNAEAMIGFEENKLAACYVAGPDSFRPPAPFNSIHTPDLREWALAPDANDDNWRSLLGRLGKLCDRDDLYEWGELSSDASSNEIEAWIGSNPESPLFVVAHTLMSARKEQEELRRQHESELRAQFAAQEAERKNEQAAKAKEADERRKREQGAVPTFLGSVFAVPIFLVVFILVSVLAYAAAILFQMLNLDLQGGGLTFGAVLLASAVSGYAGVRVARIAIDAALKAWNGWLTFFCFVTAWGVAFYYPLQVLHLDVAWLSLLSAAVQCLVSLIAAFFAIARKVDLD
jgi:hypothetical protein